MWNKIILTTSFIAHYRILRVVSAEQSGEHWIVFGRWCGLPHTSGPLITWYHPFLHVRLQALLQLWGGAEERLPAPDSHGVARPLVRTRSDTGLLQTNCVNMIIRRIVDIGTDGRESYHILDSFMEPFVLLFFNTSIEQNMYWLQWLNITDIWYPK